MANAPIAELSRNWKKLGLLMVATIILGLYAGLLGLAALRDFGFLLPSALPPPATVEAVGTVLMPDYRDCGLSDWEAVTAADIKAGGPRLKADATCAKMVSLEALKAEEAAAAARAAAATCTGQNSCPVPHSTAAHQ